MNSTLFINTARFIALLLLQVLVCNQLNFMGSLNPYVYVLFVLLYPISSNRMNLIFIAFTLGLILDLFLDSGGGTCGSGRKHSLYATGVFKVFFWCCL